MCRLFGFRSAVLSRAHRSLVTAQNALADQAREHPHGWGIGYFQSGEAYVLKSEGPAADSTSFRRAADRLASNALVAHVRRATVGEVGPLNTHPFRHGRWLFAHNGTIHGFSEIEAAMRRGTPDAIWQERLGDTDSEAFFALLLGAFQARGVDVSGHEPADVATVTDAVQATVSAVTEWAEAGGHEAPVLNFVLTNGREFFAQRWRRELHFSTQKLFCRDAGTCPEREKPCLLAVRPPGRVNHLLIASERIGDEEQWEAVADGELLAIDGEFHFHRALVA